MYVPFLKLKKNEVLSLKSLASDDLDIITPFFDIPRVKNMSEDEYIVRIDLASKDLTRHWKVGKC
jgi:hypothetical protein